MRVAIDSGPLKGGHSVRGIGAYTRELLKALNLEGVDVFREDLAKYDVVHFTSFKPLVVSLPFSKPANTKFVLTIYDLIPLIYPDHYPPGIKGRINFLINKFLIRKNVDAVITISETSKKDICRFLEVSPEKVHVIYLAPRSIFKPITNRQSLMAVKKKYGLPGSFALYVGDINYNKNIPGLVAMCENAGIKLVIVGKQAKEVESMKFTHPELKHLKGLNWLKVMRLGFVLDEDLVGIYNLADVYVQPSFYEGFALPILEAEACGTWVVASKIQAHVEIMEKGRKYSWEKTARETLKIYKNV